MRLSSEYKCTGKSAFSVTQNDSASEAVQAEIIKTIIGHTFREECL